MSGDIITAADEEFEWENNMRNKEIRAVYDSKKVRIYQAYAHEIAYEAVKLGTFGKHFKLNRMTWIKPSFLWMMYRSGWAGKTGQEHILAIDIFSELPKEERYILV